MLTLTAYFDYQYTVTVQNANPTKGAVEGGGPVFAGESVTVKTWPNSYCAFDGWYRENGSIVMLLSIISLFHPVPWLQNSI